MRVLNTSPRSLCPGITQSWYSCTRSGLIDDDFDDAATPFGKAGTPPSLRLPDRPDRRCDDRDAASICFLVCWCMDREYVAMSTGGGGEETGMYDSVADIV